MADPVGASLSALEVFKIVYFVIQGAKRFCKADVEYAEYYKQIKQQSANLGLTLDDTQQPPDMVKSNIGIRSSTESAKTRADSFLAEMEKYGLHRTGRRRPIALRGRCKWILARREKTIAIIQQVKERSSEIEVQLRDRNWYYGPTSLSLPSLNWCSHEDVICVIKALHDEHTKIWRDNITPHATPALNTQNVNEVKRKGGFIKTRSM
jgi:hypothetical protein